MLTSASIELVLPEGEKLNQSMGSVLQGMLIEKMDPKWALAMHQNDTVRPYSQYVMVEAGHVLWRLQTLTEEAFDHILVPLMKCNELLSTQRGYTIGLKNFQITRSTSYQEIEKSVWGDPRRIHHVDLQFVTSTSFKTEGSYAIFPSPNLLFKNLIRKWNTFSDASILDHPSMAEELGAQLSITDYHLHMHAFSVESRRIRAFRGSLRLGLFRNDTAARMISMLCAFAAFGGIGIKTALGMGGTLSEVSWYKEREKEV